MMAKTAICVLSIAIMASPLAAQSAERAVLVQVDRGVESDFFNDSDDARRELAAKVEMAARMACADSWTPRSTIYESINYQVDWAASDGVQSQRRKAIARNISVRCRND